MHFRLTVSHCRAGKGGDAQLGLECPLKKCLAGEQKGLGKRDGGWGR